MLTKQLRELERQANVIENNMKIYSVYHLINKNKSIEYIGCTSNPKRRYEQHVYQKPNYGHGKFYKRKDLKMEIVKSFSDKRDALSFEGEYKIANGFEWTEKIARNTDINHLQKICHLGVNTASNNTRVPVVVYDYKTKIKIGEYNSIKEAGKALGVNYGNISRVLNKKVNHSKGYYFEYKK
jgi:predicted GIY-YIG superfamily endonuclease